MTAWRILRQSLRDVLRRPREVLLIGALPRLLLPFAVGAGVLLLGPPEGHPSATNLLVEVPGHPWLAAALPHVVAALAWAWTAVAWHRLILLGERPSLRLLRRRAFWLYALYGGLLGIACLLTGVLLAGRFLHGRGGGIQAVEDTLRDGPHLLEPGFLVSLTVAMAFFLVLGLFLPGRATDRPLDIADGVRLAIGAERTILALAPVMAAAVLLGALPRLLLPELGALARLPLAALAEGTGVLIASSILTTLYARLVVRRPLEA